MQKDRHQVWHYEIFGKGRPIVLLHGIGMSHTIWNPIVPYLANKYRVIAVDIAGFGATPSLSDSVLPTISHLVDGLEYTLKEIGITEPIDLIGNSLGGFIALEAAKRNFVRSVIAISPGGLWRNHLPTAVKYFLIISYRIAKLLPLRFIRVILKSAILRELIFILPISRGSRMMPVEEAIRVTQDIVRSSAFEETLNQTGSFQGGQSISIPITIAFGERDYLLTRRSQHSENLPKQTQWVKPKKWGHVPMWVDPKEVATFILEKLDQSMEIT